MRQFHVLFSGSDASYLMRLSAGYITNTSESNFSVHTARNVMRGADQRLEVMFSYVGLEARVPADHPLRAIRALSDAALKELSRDFNRLLDFLGTIRSFDHAQADIVR
jgi:uncharacterized protein YciW